MEVGGGEGERMPQQTRAFLSPSKHDVASQPGRRVGNEPLVLEWEGPFWDKEH